jgi:hypothetical protein
MTVASVFIQISPKIFWQAESKSSKKRKKQKNFNN